MEGILTVSPTLIPALQPSSTIHQSQNSGNLKRSIIQSPRKRWRAYLLSHKRLSPYFNTHPPGINHKTSGNLKRGIIKSPPRHEVNMSAYRIPEAHLLSIKHKTRVDLERRIIKRSRENGTGDEYLLDCQCLRSDPVVLVTERR